MNTTRTRHQKGTPHSGSRYNRYWAIRIRRINGPEWRAYVAKGFDEAVRKAEHVNGCQEVLKVHELTRDEYLKAVANLEKGAVK
jgi:hypothetical protein